jgi:3-deoxy-7-phosphoheptulonate synthase
MVVVMAPDATEEQIAHVTERVESVGGQAFVSRGVVRTIIGLVGERVGQGLAESGGATGDECD